MDIKFEYLYSNGAKFIKQVYDLDEIECIAKNYNDFRGEMGFNLVARRQYAGVNNINGEEIYVGDVVYLAGYGMYEVEFPYNELYDAAAEGDIGETKGNIYENPELKGD